MNLWLSAVVVAMAVAIAVASLVALRRRAPAGGWCADSSPATPEP